jgi:neutral trehalase
MFEKVEVKKPINVVVSCKLFFLVQYDCRYGAGVGGGGEYEIQLGFGWTNGALLHIVQSLPHLWVEEEETEAAR